MKPKKVVITISDTADGGFEVSCEFKPPLKKGQPFTAAQAFAAEIMAAMNPEVERVAEIIQQPDGGAK